MSMLAIILFVGTHVLALLIGVIANSLFIERADRIAVTEAETASDPDLMALADIFIPRK